MKRTATTLLCAFTTVGLFAGMASASTPEEQAYLQQLGKGFSAGYPKTDDQLITLGHDACSKVSEAVAKGGYEPGKFDSDFAWNKRVWIEVADATKLREAAIKYLCPDATKGAATGAQGAQDKKVPTGPAGKDGSPGTAGKDGSPSTPGPQGPADKTAPESKGPKLDTAGIPGVDTGSASGGNKPAK